MSVANKIPYVSLYVIFVPRKGYLRQPSPEKPEVSVLCKFQHTFCIGPDVHCILLYIHTCSLATVITVSTNMWLMLAAGHPPLSGPIGQERKIYPQNLDIIHKQSIPIYLFESSPLHKPIKPTFLSEYFIIDPWRQNTANFSRPIFTKKVVVVSLTPTNQIFYDNLANPLRTLPDMICANSMPPPNINTLIIC